MRDLNKICVTTPVQEEYIRLSPPKLTAAGIPAILSSLKHLRNDMNLSSCRKTLFQVNQYTGFDCPGCAWPDPDDHRSGLGEYCENGAKAIAEEATYKKIDRTFFEKHTVEELSQWSDYALGKSGRLVEPMILKADSSHYEPISYEAAFEKIAQALKLLPSPDEAIFYTSGRTSNEAAFLYQLFVRMYGTNNLPDCSNMCHESSGVALSETLGIGKGSVRLEDFYLTDVIIIMGQNPGTNHPRMLSALEKAKKSGAKIITINPIPESGLFAFKNPQKLSGLMGSGTELTDLFLQVKINGDIALLKAIMYLLQMREEVDPGSEFDQAFIKNKTKGYSEFLEGLLSTDLKKVIQDTGLTEEKIERAVELLSGKKKIIVCWAMGITQHKNGVNTIREIVNLLLLKGSIGKAGAGTCPVRGHSNVQGDRTMGIWEKPSTSFLNNLQSKFEFDPPRGHGYNAVTAIQAMESGKAKIFFAMGGNFLSAAPDTKYTAKALQNCELTVQVSTKLNRSHLVTGQCAIILPCLGRTEIDIQAGGKQFVSVENSMGIVHQSRGSLSPAAKELMSEPAIVSHLAKATLGEESLNWDELISNYDHIRELIESCIPGFEDYNRRVRNEGGFYLPNGARIGEFTTADQKAKFTHNPLPNISLAKDHLVMMTIRSHDQFNTTIYGLDDRYRGIKNGRRIILMNEEDMAERSIREGDMVDIKSTFNGKLRKADNFAAITYNIPRTCTATYFPEANVLVPIDSYADRSYTPTSKWVEIKVEKSISPIATKVVR